MLLKIVDFTGTQQGKPDEALQLAELIDSTVFRGGSVALQTRRMFYLQVLQGKTPDAQKRNALAMQLYQSAKRIRQWTTDDAGLVTAASREEKYAAWAAFPPTVGAVATGYPEMNVFRQDFPPPFSAVPKTVAEGILLSQRACAYTITEPGHCLAWMERAKASAPPELLRKIEDEQLVPRFHGSSSRVAILMQLAKERNDLPAASALAKENIARNPTDWTGYQGLAALYMEQAQFGAAADTYMMFPFFKNPGNENTVAISSWAQEAGHGLARRGAVREAKRFFEIAAGHQNYSAASLSSAMSLAYYNRNFSEAEKYSLALVQRYGSGMRYYISLLFALSDTGSGWSAAKEAINRQPEFYPWSAVPVGFRAEGANVETVLKWAREAAAGSTKAFNPKFQRAYNIVVQTLAMDRPVASIESIPEMTDTQFSVPARTPGKQAPVTGYLDRFARGYLAVKRGDYPAAWEVFQTGAVVPAFINGEEAYTALPYHAFSAIKSGHKDEFVAYLDKYGANGDSSKQKIDEGKILTPTLRIPDFDLQLSRAIVAASDGLHDKANEALSRALGALAEPQSRPMVPEYVFAEVCELLATETGRASYLEPALELAKGFQVYEPWASWAYAFEAKYGKSLAARGRALAMTEHLDRQSARIAGIDEKVKDAAKHWRSKNKPFARDSTPVTGERSL
jgi:tetratricopeptide (TPR) repeat protein